MTSFFYAIKCTFGSMYRYNLSQQILWWCAILSLCLLSCTDRSVPAEVDSNVRQLFVRAESTDNLHLREKVYDSAYVLLRKSDRTDLLFELATRYEQVGAPEKYLSTCHFILKSARWQNDTTSVARSSFWLGFYHETHMNPDSAFFYYRMSEKMYRASGDVVNYGRSVLKQSAVLYDSGNFPEGINQGIRALQILNKTEEHYLIFDSYLKVALSLKEVKDYPKAIDYFNRAFSELNKMKPDELPEENRRYLTAMHYNNLGTVYERLDQNDRAILFYDRGLQTSNLIKDWPELYAALLANKAYARMKTGKLDGVRQQLLRALTIRDSIRTVPGMIASQIKLGEYLLKTNDTAQALDYFKKGYALSRQINASAEMLQTLKLLTENDRRNKGFYSDIYFKVNDSVQAVERATQNKFARIAYETDQIEKQNQSLSRRNKIIAAVSMFAVLLAVAGLVILRLNARNKALVYAQQQQQANEQIYQLILKQQSQTEAARNEERNRIAMELHDGIVNSIFTTRFNLMQLDVAASDKKQQLIAELEKTEQEVRKVSHELQNALFVEDKNMAEILSRLVASQQNDTQTEFDLSVDKYIDWSTVSDTAKIHVYRIVQEAIQNVHKYARAGRCLIMVFKTGDKITLRIWDNGVGFNTEKARQGIGLRNITTRAKALGGTLKITSSPGNGTTIAVVF